MFKTFSHTDPSAIHLWVQKQEEQMLKPSFTYKTFLQLSPSPSQPLQIYVYFMQLYKTEWLHSS